MKKAYSFLFCIFFLFSLSVQSQYETIEIELSRAGDLETIKQKVPPLDTYKAMSYDSLNMTFTGGWSLGQSFCITSSPTGDTVFAGAGAGVIIFDATDPYNMIKLSEVHARALVDDIQYSPEENRLYLSAYFSGLEVWDISDILNPYRLSRIGTSGLPRAGVYIPKHGSGENAYAYMVTVADGIDKFMIDPLGQPEYITNSIFTGALTWTSCGYGDTLFISSGTSGTMAIDLVPPNMANLFTVSGNSTGIAALNNFLYVVDYNTGLKIYDFETLPASLSGSVSLPGYPYRVCALDGLAYVANSTTNPGGGINIVETSDPSNPALIGEYPEGQTFVTGNPLASFSTGNMDGLVAVDLTDPTNPQFASNYLLPLSTNDIAVKNDYAYMGNNGFRVFDVSDKSMPLQVGYDETDGALVKVNGNQAVICPKSMGSSNKVSIMDIANPANPQKLAHVTAPYMTYDLDLKGKTAYLACWWDGIRVVDFSNPENPTWGSHVMGWVNGAIPGEEFLYCQALDVSGDYLYAVDYGPFPDDDSRGLYIFDITDPLNPVLAKRYIDYEGQAKDIEVSGGYAYITDANGGLSIVSVEDPYNPSQVSYLPLADAAWGVDVFGSYAFVANYINEGVQAIDITDPENPTVEGYYKKSGCFALNVTYDAGHVFVSDGPAGMQIYNFDFLNHTNEPVIAICYGYEIYPNPAENTLNILSINENTDRMALQLYDMSGKQVGSWTLSNFPCGSTKKIDISQFTRGLYLLGMTTGDDSSIQKIILH